jgi:hypothetical protein
MNININNNGSIFDTLEAGDVFLYKGRPVIKLLGSFLINDYGCNGVLVNAIYLDNMEFCNISWDEPVIKCKAKLNIEFA